MSARRLLAMSMAATAAGTALLAMPPSDARPPVGPATAAACAPNPRLQKASLRAMWIATVANRDWPSRPGLSIAQQKSELISYLDMAVRQRHNAVVLQVRPTADAFWRSSVEPWSKFLTGTAGRSPGYDPLGFAVTKAHRRNLELHAWFNPFRVSLDTRRRALPANHPARLHPGWVVSYGGQLVYNPGIPGVRRLVENAIMDAVVKYNLDAVHLDDYFYPYPVAGAVFPDTRQYARYGQGYASRADWRRHNINLFIRQLGSRIHEAKPWVKFGVSPFAVWRNRATDPGGSATAAGVQTYDDLYADTRRWVRMSWIDYVAPQVYWARGYVPADYEKVTAWWSRQVPSTVSLYIGHATYKVGTSTQSPDWSTATALSGQLAFNAALPNIDGNLFFGANDVRANRLAATSRLNRYWYRRPALVPPMPWIDRSAPWAPRDLAAARLRAGIRLTWQRGGASTRSYAVYRIPGRVNVLSGSCVLADARYLVATRRGVAGTQTFVDTGATRGTLYTYVVTGLDRTWNESAPVRRTVRG